MADILNYKANIQSFIDALKGIKIKEIVLIEDENPLFKKASLPFDFKYCSRIYVLSHPKNFEILPSQSEQGLDTFWIRETKSIEETGTRKKLNQIASISGFEKHKLTYRIELEFSNQILILIVGEVYEKKGGEYDFKSQDEMILVFEKKEDALKFELLTK